MCIRDSRAAAEGSATLLQSGGYRPFLEYRNDFTQNSTLRRRAVVKVYAQAGGTPLLGPHAHRASAGPPPPAPGPFTKPPPPQPSPSGDRSSDRQSLAPAAR